MTTPDSETTSTRRSNPIWFGLAGAFMTLLLVAGGAMLWTTRDTDEQAAPAPTPPPTAPPVTDQGDGFGTPITDRWGDRIEVPVNQFGQVLPQDASQQLKPEDPGYRTQPAKGVMWQLVYNIPMPFSTSDGPTKVADKVASGYAHTPQGAVLAAIDGMSRCSVQGDNVAVACFEQRLTDGPGMEKLREAAFILGPAPRQLVPGASLPPLAWAKVLNYADDYMAVELAQRDPRTGTTPTYVVYPVEMVWVDGDWKVKATNNSQHAREGVRSLDGFTRW